MTDDQAAALQQQIGVLIRAQLATASRLVLLEEAFVVLAAKLAQGSDNPVLTLETYIAELEAAITMKKGLQATEAPDAAFQLGLAFDNFVQMLRSRIPGATEGRPAH